MIARIWRGATREADKDTYFEYLQKTGLKEYAVHPRQSGCVGFTACLRRQIRIHPDFALGFMGCDQSLRRSRIRECSLLSRRRKVL